MSSLRNVVRSYLKIETIKKVGDKAQLWSVSLI